MAWLRRVSAFSTMSTSAPAPSMRPRVYRETLGLTLGPRTVRSGRTSSTESSEVWTLRQNVAALIRWFKRQMVQTRLCAVSGNTMRQCFRN